MGASSPQFGVSLRKANPKTISFSHIFHLPKGFFPMMDQQI
jgi:hypothetical protein